MKPPIFVIGSGRSGTTLLYEILASHESLAFVCNLTNRLPVFPQASALCGSNIFQKHYAFKPASEAKAGFKYCGINEFPVPIDIEHIRRNPDEYKLQQAKDKTRQYFTKHCRAFGRDRIVSKNTANSMKIELLNEIFPDAYFLHIYRNPYSVISSLLNVPFWPELDLWWSDKSPSQLEEQGVNKYETAGTHWSNQIDIIWESKKNIDSQRFLEVAYEDLVGDLHNQMSQILNFCDLEYTDAFKKSLDSLNVNKKSLDKWKTIDASANYKAANQSINDRATDLGYELI